MTELLTAAQMRAIENAAIESGKVTSLELMERAGRGTVEAVFEEWPELLKTSQTAAVLCGPGNNGGDGFVVARLLKEWGWQVEVFLYGEADKLPPDARVNYDRWFGLGEVAQSWDAYQKCERPDVVIDAVFGIGLTRPLDAQAAQGLDVRRRQKWPRHFATKFVAVDCPSGLEANSGRRLQGSKPDELRCLNLADLTVTFHAPKLCHYLGEGAAVCGKVKIVDLGLWGFEEDNVVPGLDPVPTHARLLDRSFRNAKHNFAPVLAGMLEKNLFSHKFDNGHALILAGGSGKTGAARLAARGALRIGAGLVTLGVSGAAQMEVASQITALMLRRAGAAEELSIVLQDERINALCLGPALGLDRARQLVPVALKAKRATVLDADALSAYADDPATLFAMLHNGCVLTPHGGEFARLFPDLAGKLSAPAVSGPAFSKVDATREAAERAGCVVLYKGADTVIAAPDGRCSISAALYERAAPWLATAGAGDVLAGFITGLLARGFEPLRAAETGAWLHVECARSFGAGLIAEDLPEELPQVFKQMGI